MENQALVANSPAEMIRQAVSGSADLEKLGKLLELQERWEANEAKKAYFKAKAAFKANPPSIEKNKKVSFGNTKYSHATLDNVVDTISKALSEHGLSTSWRVQQNGTISVTCIITHELGYSEETTISAPSDTSGSKNAIQAIGSTISYLERYAMLAVTGMAAHEMDDDGKVAATELITKAEADGMIDKLVDMGASVDKFLAYMKLEKMTDMPKSELGKAKIAIENFKKPKAAVAK